MRPKERRDSGQKDLFRARLDQIVDMGHPLAKLARSVDWGFLETQFGAAYWDSSVRRQFAVEFGASERYTSGSSRKGSRPASSGLWTRVSRRWRFSA
jgi:hypothetical protein